MKLAIVGTGAMGGLYAAAFADGGAQVTAVDTDAGHIAAIVTDGLQLRRGAGTTTRRLGDGVVAGSRTTSEPADVVMVFTKGYDTESALTAAQPWIGPDTVFLTLQNGLGNADRIRARYPTHTIVYGLTTQTAGIVAPGIIEARSNGPAETWLWGTSMAGQSAAARIAATLTAGGIRTEAAPDIDRAIWRKLVVNCSLNPLCALLDSTVGDVAERPESWPLLDGVATEIATIANAIGVQVGADEARRYLREVATEAARHHPSMVADLRAGRPTEIDNLNGAVLAIARSTGIDAPSLQALDVMLRLREHRTRTAGVG